MPRHAPVLALLLAAALAGCWAHERPRNVDPPDGDADVDADVDADADADLVVHEWGVFSGGQVHAHPRRWQDTMADKPVLYFYTGSPLTVEVEVSFNGGRAAETWPEVALGETIGWSDVRLTGRPCGAEFDPFPAYGEGQCESRYTWFCEASELGDYVVPEASCLETGGVRSPLLFYSGPVGELPAPISGRFCVGHHLPPDPESDGGWVDVELAGELGEPVGPVLLVYRDLQGECWPWGGCRIDRAVVGTAWVESLVPGAEIALQIPATLLWAESHGWVQPPDWLQAEEASLRAVLVDEGLTGDEAEALLAGWRHVFFDLQPDDNFVSVPLGESLAAVTVLPRAYFDEALPIRIDPVPRELVRVGLDHRYLGHGWCDAPSDSGEPEGS